jgi:hypothetical protein
LRLHQPQAKFKECRQEVVEGGSVGVWNEKFDLVIFDYHMNDVVIEARKGHTTGSW